MAETLAFDAAQYLTSAQAQAELLNDALASGDAAHLSYVLDVIARARGQLTSPEVDDTPLAALLSLTRALGVTLTTLPDRTSNI